MPRKKQTSYNASKPRLVFLESPKQGLRHEYGLPPDKAAHPVCVPTKPLDHNASASWVTPQFDQTEELHFPARRRLRHMSSNTTLQNRSELRGSGTRPGACKFPSLSFTKGTVKAPRKRSVCARPKPTLPKQRERNVLLSPLPQEDSCSNVLTPPDVRTPETSLNCNTELPNGIPVGRSPDRGQDKPRDGFDSPVMTGPSHVLAEDTPEHEYGVKNTWRRREQLMTYLKARGRLKKSQIVVQV
ncbi:RAD9, HUS1, RAD1-interacting nuclear orphan protein 1 [Xenopus tropicalis]|uniref:Novel protein n=1 Tax=Xenopus tropicalis TaxID=8364 RepID=Q28DD5_XENTR|nr:RAD9, HUS1, RAD1-interacting nuclear orphan protein 1 [Xenopus tropicalis]CAJ82253.1 novel protein [Xenopus tropicalis]|eukprot:NP_001039069.1 RAD9, HUS1, RAD1-interacting nuclear orphan protein 1 [Xenopus tropicalis]